MTWPQVALSYFIWFITHILFLTAPAGQSVLHTSPGLALPRCIECCSSRMAASSAGLCG